ncbi:MAG: nucleotidyltransferase [Bacteroidetes bacterium]|nr:MAG: nucleotidyltransferase [Bacteroidota bacterium]
MASRESKRWIQRFDNYNRAFSKLDEAVHIVKSRFYTNGKFDKTKMEGPDEIIIEGLIQRFEYTHELAWNVMKDFLESRGSTEIFGSRDATREGFQKGLITDGETWMEMIKSRNKSSHTYNEKIAVDIFVRILESYHTCFEDFQAKMASIKEKEERT